MIVDNIFISTVTTSDQKAYTCKTTMTKTISSNVKSVSPYLLLGSNKSSVD